MASIRRGKIAAKQLVADVYKKYGIKPIKGTRPEIRNYIVVELKKRNLSDFEISEAFLSDWDLLNL